MQKLSEHRPLQRTIHLKQNALHSDGKYGGRRPTIISSGAQILAPKCGYGSLHNTSNQPSFEVFTCTLDYPPRHQIRKHHVDK